MNTQIDDQQRNQGRIVAGIVVIVVGLAMLADRTGFNGLHLSGRYWPLILIALGLVKLAGAPGRDGRHRSSRPGAWLVFVGFWGLVSEFHAFGFDYGNSWPLLVIGAGLGIVWRAFEKPAGCGPVREN
jgi:hypothetical protein